MKLEVKAYGALCSLSTFEINGIKAEADDFGDQEDEDKENAEDYGCGNMKFRRNTSTEKTLEKYNISRDEYAEVCDRLEDLLSFGQCGWCV